MKHQLIVIFLHLLFWTQNLVRILTFSEPYTKTEIIYEQILIAAMCYINYFLFVPYILRKNNFKYYLLWLFVFTAGFTVVFVIWTLYQPDLFGVDDIPNDMNLWLNCFNISLLYGAMSTGSRLTLDWTHNQQKNKELSLQKTTAQIQLMKSNVNMPFLLQVLNYTEEVSKPDPHKAEKPIMLISDVLRYGLYESESLSVPIIKEIEIIESYLELQKLIYPKKFTPLVVQGRTQQIQIVPNILLRIISIWRSLIDKKQDAFDYPINLACETTEVHLKLTVRSITSEDMKFLTKSIKDYNNDHITISLLEEADILRLTITSIYDEN